MTAQDVKDLQQRMLKINLDDAQARDQMLGLARQMVDALENPVKKTMQHIFAWTGPATIRVASELKVFKLLQDGPLTAGEIANRTGAEESLVVRIMRKIVDLGICRLDQTGRYSAASVANMLAVPSFAAGYEVCFDVFAQVSMSLPEYLKKTGHKDPESHTNGPFQDRFGGTDGLFGWMNKHPEALDRFNLFMTAYRQARPPWTTVFPVKDIVYDQVEDPSTICVVDVGGGFGHDLQSLRRALDPPPGKLVLIEQASVIDSRPDDLKAGIEAIVHDFFTPLPVQGASIYYLKHILHDWPTPDVVTILKAIAVNMKVNYSKILVLDNILAAELEAIRNADLDITMMVGPGGRQRNEQQWRGAFQQAGLKLKRYWREADGDGLMEVVLEDDTR